MVLDPADPLPGKRDRDVVVLAAQALDVPSPWLSVQRRTGSVAVFYDIRAMGRILERCTTTHTTWTVGLATITTDALEALRASVPITLDISLEPEPHRAAAEGDVTAARAALEALDEDSSSEASRARAAAAFQLIPLPVDQPAAVAALLALTEPRLPPRAGVFGSEILAFLAALAVYQGLRGEGWLVDEATIRLATEEAVVANREAGWFWSPRTARALTRYEAELPR